MPRSHPTIAPPLAAPRRQRRRRRGMTMAEVLIAAVLLAFVIMSSLTALSQAYGFTHHARMTTLAGQIVQSVMEDLRLRNFNDIKNYAAQSTQPVAFNILSSERFSSAFTQLGSFAVTGNFSTTAASTSTQLGKIAVTLTVTWREKNTTFTRSLTTYFGEKGLTDYYYVGWTP